MKVIGIVGSPRHGKNTASLVESILKGAESGGADTALYYLHDHDIRPCQACDACKLTGKCVQEDDMRVLYEALDEAQGLVLGTPIYLDHVSAQTKLLLDRMHAYLGPALVHYYHEGVKAVLVATWGDSDPRAYDDVIDWLKRRFSFYFSIETVGVIKGAGTDSVSVSDRADLCRAAFDAGVRLVRRLG